jgi:ribonuclease D
MTDLPAPVWVARRAALVDLVAELQRHARIAVDTEANSLHAYRDRVCLIQFSTPKADYLVDPLELVDLSPLAPVFANPKIEKIFHAAEYDIFGLQRDHDFTFANLFDTMVAARTLGYKAVGLGDLLASKFGVEVNKKHQRANWGARPLPPDMIDYARHDTHYLIELRDLLSAELTERGRRELACEEFARLSRLNGHNNHDARQPWERINGQQDLDRRQQTVLNALCHSRERLAEKMDRPLFKVLDDRILIAIAGACPKSKDDLQNIGLSERQIQRFAHDILAAVRKGLEAPLVHCTGVERLSESVNDRLNRLKDWRKRAGVALGVESDIILPRAYLLALAEQAPQSQAELAEIMGESPYRLEQFGAEILKVITRQHK